MLGKKTEEKPCDTIDTLIGHHTELKGDIVFTGGLRIDGKVRGNVTAKDDSSSMLVVSDQGQVDGSVNVAHVVINGVVNGNLNSSGTVELQSKANISGDLNYRQLRMDLGAAVNGNLVCDQERPASTRLKTMGATTAVGVGKENIAKIK
ncbi:MAG: polymer-forming cytoskeletal protein [Gammaproteobacteria bacterium]|nr:polymer-forming cytoskeletal protein [Gammaproteobacteria bacterium]